MSSFCLPCLIYVLLLFALLVRAYCVCVCACACVCVCMCGLLGLGLLMLMLGSLEAWNHLKGLALVGYCRSMFAFLSHCLLVMTCFIWAIANLGKNKKEKILRHVMLSQLQFQCTVLAQFFLLPKNILFFGKIHKTKGK